MSWRDDYRRVRQLANPRDGYIDRYVNRRFSSVITVALLHTKVTPNQVTIASGVTGLVAGALIAFGGYWMPLAGALVFQLSVALDSVDGELARLKQQFSPYGEWLDIVTDTLATIAVFVGIALAVGRDLGEGSLYVAGGLLVSANFVTFPLVTYLERRIFPTAPPTPTMRHLERFVVALSGRDVSVIVFLAALAGRLHWFLWAAAIGAHVFWVVVLWLWYVARQEQSATTAAHDPPAGTVAAGRGSQRNTPRPTRP